MREGNARLLKSARTKIDQLKRWVPTVCPMTRLCTLLSRMQHQPWRKLVLSQHPAVHPSCCCRLPCWPFCLTASACQYTCTASDTLIGQYTRAR